MSAIKVIFHVTDFSEQAGYAFSIACSLACSHEARLIVIHLAPSGRLTAYEFPFSSLSEIDLASSWKDLTFGNGRRWIPSVKSFLPDSSIAEFTSLVREMAEEFACDLVLLAEPPADRREAPGLPFSADQFLKEGAIPVLLVKTPNINVRNAEARGPTDDTKFSFSEEHELDWEMSGWHSHSKEIAGNAGFLNSFVRDGWDDV